MTTMRQVAAAAGVSQKTVSRVFRDDPHVLPATRGRVLSTMRALNYTPNALATTFRAGRAPVIGVAVPDVVDPFFGEIARAIDHVVARHDMSTLVTSIGDDADREVDIVESLLRRSPSGLILASEREDQRYLTSWAAKLPVVFVDRAPTGLLADSFTEDDVAGARLATEHLLGHGHRRIAFIGDAISLPTTSGRLNGYRQALLDAGVEPDDDLLAFDLGDEATAEHALRRIEQLPEPPTAVFSSNGRVSMTLVPAIQRRPLDMVSFGDFPMAGALARPLTTIDQNPARIGALAAERVIARIAEPDGSFERTTVLQVRLLERASCANFAPKR